MYIGRTPLGFGSSSSRFPREEKDDVPGPGSYDPKSPSKQVHGGHFSKAKRFPSKQDSALMHQLGLKESYQHLSALRDKHRKNYQWKKKGYRMVETS